MLYSIGFKPVLLICILLLVSACEKGGDQLINIPEVAVSCSLADDAVCAAAINSMCRPSAFVVMTRSGCGDQNFSPEASGSVSLSCDLRACTGVVNSWLNEGESITQFFNGTMDICTYIDVDCNLQKVTGDLENETSVSIQSSEPIPITSWSVVQ